MCQAQYSRPLKGTSILFLFANGAAKLSYNEHDYYIAMSNSCSNFSFQMEIPSHASKTSIGIRGRKIVKTPGSSFRLVTVQFIAYRLILAVLIMDLPWFELQSSYFCWFLVLQSVFMKLSFNFERAVLATRGCSRTLKTSNPPPLLTSDSFVLAGGSSRRF